MNSLDPNLMLGLFLAYVIALIHIDRSLLDAETPFGIVVFSTLDDRLRLVYRLSKYDILRRFDAA
jgi:hypothetical protein